MSDSINAKEEFLEATKGEIVICSRIEYEGNSGIKTFILKEGYTQEELDSFINSLDFEYDAGYGSQDIYGVILCKGDVWFDRGEYDGSEWWERHKCPSPKEVVSKQWMHSY